MRKIFIISLLGLAVVACKPDNSDDKITPGGGGNTTTLEITLNDNGFTKADGSNGYAREFSAGMSAGLFAMVDGVIVEGFNNLEIVASGYSDLTWAPKDSSGLSFPTDADYFIYYPYAETLPSSINLTGSNAGEFFANVITAWTIADDQSSKADFESSDLIIGAANAEENRLHFELTHAFGIVAATFPGTIYTFTNTNYDIPDYIVSAARPEFYDKVPYSKGGEQLYIVRDGDFNIPYVYVNENEALTGSATAGSCVTLAIGQAEVIEHELQIGDFYLADGTLLSKDAPISTVTAANVIGIVTTIDPGRIGQGEKDALGGTAHALVLATRRAGGGYELYRWYTDYSSNAQDVDRSVRDESAIGFTRIPELDDAVEIYNLVDADIEGYKNYHLLMTQRADDVAAGHYPGFAAVANFSNEDGVKGPVSGVSTGWFLPASGQLLDAVRNLANLSIDGSNVSMSDMPGTLTWGGNGYISNAVNATMSKVSSGCKTTFADYANGMQVAAEASESNFRYVDFGNHGYVDYLSFYKFTTTAVRPMLAF